MFFVNKKSYLNLLIFITFSVLSFSVGINHEPWADEAQSWLIARDCSFYDIIFTRCSYQGAPFLWFYILKLFILIGWSYKYIFVISWIFSCIGVYLFLFKSKLPTIIKILFPFNYYIFYQYTCVARSYCLVFPILCLIAIVYDKRYEKIYLYCFLLSLLASIYAYSYVFAVILALFLITDFFLDNIKRKFNIKEFFVRSVPVFVLFIYFLFIYYISKKNSDCFFVLSNVFSNGNIIKNLLKLFIECFFDTTDINIFIFSTCVFYVLFFYYISINAFCKTNTQKIYFVFLNLSMFVAMSVLHYSSYHTGIFLLILIFFFWIYKKENKLDIVIKNNKIFYLFLIMILLFSISFSIKISMFDINQKYDYSAEVADIIKQNRLDEKKILGINWGIVAVQPYFQKNIFLNTGTSYWTFSKTKFDEYLQKTEKLISNADAVVVVDIAPVYENISRKILNSFKRCFLVKVKRFSKSLKVICNTTCYIFVKE